MSYPLKDIEHARVGILYIWRRMEAKTSIAEILRSGAMEAYSEIKKDDLDFPEIDALERNSSFERSSRRETIKEWAADFLAKVWEQIKQVFGDVKNTSIGSYLKRLVTYVAQLVYEQELPGVSTIKKLAQGLGKTTVAFCRKLKAWLAARNVELAEGHPTAIIEGIKKGMTRSLLQGVYIMAKEALLAGFDFVATGISSFVRGAAAVLETVVRLMWRLGEVYVIRKFIKQADEYYQERKDRKAFHKNGKKFTKWLTRAMLKSPVIAGLTYGSHIVGDQAMFLQVYNKDGTVISQKQFNKGSKYLTQMKEEGIRLVLTSGIRFKSSDDGVQTILLNHFYDPWVRFVDKPDMRKSEYDKMMKKQKKKKGFW